MNHYKTLEEIRAIKDPYDRLRYIIKSVLSRQLQDADFTNLSSQEIYNDTKDIAQEIIVLSISGLLEVKNYNP